MTILLPALLSPPAAALDSDRDQPVLIVADEAERNDSSGLITYRGNVTLDQGTLHVEAQQITVHRVDAEGDRVVATGAPAYLRQQPEPDGALLHAWGGTIEYLRLENRVLLKDAARLEQDGTSLAGDTIDYFINEQRVRAAADDEPEQRVRMVIPPHDPGPEQQEP